MKRILASWLVLTGMVAAQEASTLTAKIEREKEGLLGLYRHLHANPELSFMEEKTSARLAEEMRAVGFEVTEKVGGWGVVAVYKNGPGKTVLVRTDMDALPVRELTGLPFASKVKTKDKEGNDVSVMHACGHDMHMSCWVGAAKTLLAIKDQWKGTLVFIGQPAEERGGGAGPMLKDGLYTRFPKPDACLALHCAAEIPAGSLGMTYKGATASVDNVDIIVHGVGGHGAQPQATKDPVVLAAQIVLALQTVASREVHPLDPVVVTVGSIHGGTKHNIISDQVTLQLTIRTVDEKTRYQVLEAIKRIVRGQGISAGLPEALLPEVKENDNYTPVLVNDDGVSKRLVTVFERRFGAERVRERKPTMGGEDFSRYGMTEDKIPICMFWLGATPAAKVAEAAKLDQPLPSLHSPFFRPDAEPALVTGVEAMTMAVLDVLKQP
ncbi:MAG: amidohydrolase [Prosthecobacter sp.]|nr:amidohydrolase [Prosthecobacter sp.]